MFCDLADSTHLSAQLDPEDMGDVIRAYQEAVSEAVRHFDGYIAKFMGDGVLVYFGYPNAQEKDAERAVRTGLAILDALPALNAGTARGNGTRLAVRIGIASGLVVVGETIGEGAAREQTVVGDTPNLAARLQALAGPDAILISAATHDLVGDIFACEGLGAHALKGIAEPVQVWRVAGLREEEDAEFETTAADFPLVGRDEEIGLLRRAWQQTKEEGHGQVVFVSGEPGHRQIGAGRHLAPRGARRGADAHHLPLLALPHEQRALSGGRALETPRRVAAGGRRRGPARQARKRAGALSAAARGGRAAVRIAAVIAARRWLSEARSDAGTAQGADRGRDRRVDPGGSRAATAARGLGRRALGRPVDLGPARPADRSGADGAAA